MTPNELLVTVTAMFPRAFPSETAVSTWLDVYRKTLGHLKSHELEEAWNRTIARWEKTSPPMPKHILDNVPVTVRAGAISDGKTMRGLADALPQLCGDLMRAWWQANAHWFEDQCEARLLTAEQKRKATWWVNRFLQEVAHYQAQLAYWKDDNSPAKLSDGQVDSVFSLCLASNESPRYAPSMEVLKAAYVRDGNKAYKHDHWYSWMEKSDPERATSPTSAEE